VPDELIAAAHDLLAARVSVVDPAEAQNFEDVFAERYDEWKRWQRIEWTHAGDGEVALMRAAGSYATPEAGCPGRCRNRCGT
jgi:hypothetical protein